MHVRCALKLTYDIFLNSVAKDDIELKRDLESVLDERRNR